MGVMPGEDQLLFIKLCMVLSAQRRLRISWEAVKPLFVPCCLQSWWSFIKCPQTPTWILCRQPPIGCKHLCVQDAIQVTHRPGKLFASILITYFLIILPWTKGSAM
jgi:hypothetical protein